MNRLIKGACLGLGFAFAGQLSADYVPVEYVASDSTVGQWINTGYTPASTDKIELKIRFLKKDATQCLFCSRGTSTTTNTYTAFIVSNQFRFDHSANGVGSGVGSMAKDVDYDVTVDGYALTATVTGGSSPIETTLASSAFTGGSPMTLLGSHTAGTGLSAESEIGNRASARLYSVKITDKDGTVVRNFVPVTNDVVATGANAVGLYDTVTKTFVGNTGKGVLGAGAATGAAAYPVVASADTYEVNVPGSGYVEITAEQVAAAAGKTLVKTGSGSLVAGTAMANFAGDIRIREGYFVVSSKSGLGTSAGATYVEGGTLVNQVGNSQTNGKEPSFVDETIHLRGTGCGDNGAMQNKNSNVDFARKVILDDATKIVTDQRLDFRGASFNMNGYKLTVESRSGGFFLVNVTMSRMGDIETTMGYLEFQSYIGNSASTATVTMRTGSQLGLWGLSSWLNCKFVLEPGVKIRSTNGTFKYAGTDNRNILSVQPFEMHGLIVNDLDKNTQWQFRGKMTGAGGITGGKGGYLQLINSAGNNDFAGGLDISGVVENGAPVGGIVTYSDGNIPSGDGATPLKLTNAGLQMRDKDVFHLPDLVAHGTVVISNMLTVTNCQVKSLTKTGADELTLFGPLCVTGKTAIASGTVRFATRMPENVPGLKWNYKNQQSGPSSYVDQGIDATGVGYGYKSWPSGTNIYMNYSGYIRVPGEDGEEVTCNWMTSMARGCKVTIGGVVCCDFNDNKNTKDDITVGYARLAMYKPVTLRAGWQQISVYFGNWYNTTRGPQANTELGWAANFGVGVDWQCRSVTNTAYYAKLLDPGDGSFLRATTNAADRTALLVESRYRPTFRGDVAFGPGAVLDINDTAPYWPVKVPSLTGLPTVLNGALEVQSGTWTLRLADLTNAVPLTVGANATVTFPATVTIDGDAAALAYRRTIAPRSLVSVAAGGTLSATTFELSAGMKAAGYTLGLVDGLPVIGHPVGMVVVVR